MSDERARVIRDNVIMRKEKNSKKRLFGENNKAFVSGRIESELEFSHEIMWEKFYETRVRVNRFDDKEDFVPVVVSELLLREKNKLAGKLVEVAGQFRSHNKCGEDGCQHKEMFLFATEINICEDEDELEESTNCNSVYLDGYICSTPEYKKKLSGKEITELLLAVDRRQYGKSDYISCVTWGRMAYWAKFLKVGERIRLYGRIHSREYFKKLEDVGKVEVRVAYEVSVNKIQKVDELS